MSQFQHASRGRRRTAVRNSTLPQHFTPTAQKIHTRTHTYATPSLHLHVTQPEHARARAHAQRTGPHTRTHTLTMQSLGSVPRVHVTRWRIRVHEVRPGTPSIKPGCSNQDKRTAREHIAANAHKHARSVTEVCAQSSGSWTRQCTHETHHTHQGDQAWCTRHRECMHAGKMAGVLQRQTIAWHLLAPHLASPQHPYPNRRATQTGGT
jgi:hypothetical protein